MTTKEFVSDFLIIGSGIAGLSFALKAATLGSVTLVTKKSRIDTATNLAQGGIAAVLSDDDSFASHVQDTLKAGAGICSEEIVRMVVENGPERIRELIDLGVSFNRNDHGSHLDLTREGGHSARRIAHAYDLTGHEIERCLLASAAGSANITILENHCAVDLLLASKAGLMSEYGGEQCLGAYVLDNMSGEIHTFQAKTTVLCTGGCGKVYLYTTNPDIATGDGVAMAYRAGAKVANLEFVQFHPTCLFDPKAKNFLISEAVRGEGGRLIDKAGITFMDKYDPRGDLATRDTVARAIDSELKASGDDSVFLDITHQSADFVRTRFPNIYQTCLSFGIDITKQPIPVVPAAHYMCGGVLTDAHARTSIPGLFAFGETACTGLHGGNRLASNSLLEAVVFAHQAFCQCQIDWPEVGGRRFQSLPAWSSGRAARIKECVLITHNWDQIRRLMWNYVGIVRSDKRLNLVQARLAPILAEVDQHYQDYLLTPDLIELRNIATMAQLIVTSARIRKESRGLHYNVDHPFANDREWRKYTVLCQHQTTEFFPIGP
ncbi:MAG: L-aspartate oxidase [Proteobacteria bacterium]|nr:L-aspartate oxidase [Desulfobulbaceae bacterium]MBU4153097.1 L-aspartate oxidase [Pseudomonadota bacterium]